MPRTTNLDQVTGTDRQAVGPQQDNATPSGGQSASGGGGGPPSGPVGGDGAGSTYPNIVISGLSGVGRIIRVPIAYATGGNIQIRFDLGSYSYLRLSTSSASFSPGGSTGLVAGATQTIDLGNAFGSPIALTWNPSWKQANGPLPSTLATGETFRLELSVGINGTESSVVATYFPTVTSSSGVPWFNVNAYGAINDNSTDSSAAINAAIAALNAAGQGVLYLPGGQGYVSSSSNLSAITVPATVMGDGVTVSKLRCVGTFGIVFDYSAGGNHVPATCRDLQLIQSTSGTGVGLKYIPGSSPSDLSMGPIFYNIQMDGGWRNGLYIDSPALNHVAVGYINNVTVNGNPGSITDTDVAFNVANSSGLTMGYLKVTWSNYSFYLDGDCEGNTLKDSSFTAVNFGIYTTGGSTTAGGNTFDNVEINCQINAVTNGAVFSNAQSFYSKIYGLPDGASATFMTFVNGQQCSITDCLCLSTGSRWSYGIQIGAGCSYTQIEACRLYNITGFAVDVSASNYSDVDNVKFNDVIGTTALVGGGTNFIRNCFGQGSNVDGSWTPGHY